MVFLAAVSCGDPHCVNSSFVLIENGYTGETGYHHCHTNYAFEGGIIEKNSTCELKSHGNGSVYGEWTPVNGSCEREFPAT